MIGIAGARLSDEERRWLESPLSAGVILFSRNFESRAQLCSLVESIHAIRSPALLVAVDQEGGRVQRFKEPFTRLPAMRSIGRLYDADSAAAFALARDVGWLMAAELRACGVDLSFAPVVELDLGLAEVIGDRAFHDTADGVVAVSRAFVSGMQEAGMAATAKHFPTHAGAVADSHAELAADSRDYSDLIDDLLPYRALIAEGLHSVMVAHVSFPRLDPLPASMSEWWIERQLRNELGFAGAVISDDISMLGAAVGGSLEDRARKALHAGCDLVLVCDSAEALGSIYDALNGYSDPAAQLRLMRLRATARYDWDELRASQRWLRVAQALDRLGSTPQLQLRG